MKDSLVKKIEVFANIAIINEAYQTTAPSIGAGGAPSVLLINDKGEVVENRLGKLPEIDEEKVFERIKSVS
jgi:hypothetical protein